MGKLVFGGVLLGAAFLLMIARAGVAGRPAGAALRTVALLLAAVGVGFLVFSGVVVMEPGQVGVRHAFGYVDPTPLLPGVRFVPPWSQVERYSIREEQYPLSGREAETIPALSREQMGLNVDVQYTINDVQQRDKIAEAMESRTDSALITRPRSGEGSFRIAKLTAFFLRNLEPPPQVVQAINNKIAQEQQIETERHRVEVARLQSEQQRLLNQTLTSEALTKQYLEVLHDLRSSNNLVLLVPTEGGLPLLDIGALRRNLGKPQ